MPLMCTTCLALVALFKERISWRRGSQAAGRGRNGGATLGAAARGRAMAQQMHGGRNDFCSGAPGGSPHAQVHNLRDRVLRAAEGSACGRFVSSAKPHNLTAAAGWQQVDVCRVLQAAVCSQPPLQAVKLTNVLLHPG